MSVIIRPDQIIPGELSRVAELLLAAAGDVRDVKLETFGDGPYFVVPDSLASKVNLNPEEETKPETKGKKRKES